MDQSGLLAMIPFELSIIRGHSEVVVTQKGLAWLPSKRSDHDLPRAQHLLEQLLRILARLQIGSP